MVTLQLRRDLLRLVVEGRLNEGGTKQERVYTVEGLESLTEGSWGPSNSASRFFRVSIEMPWRGYDESVAAIS